MAREQLQQFFETAEGRLASVRSSLLISAQTAGIQDLRAARKDLSTLAADATADNLFAIAELAEECGILVETTISGGSPHAAYLALDGVARLEAALLDQRMQNPDFFADITTLVDDSFGRGLKEEGSSNEDFEIDEETLEIFRSEADDLLCSITNGLSALSTSPENQNVLWEIRRCIHTFKGAAGIVGLTEAAGIAHRMEDLLDRLVATRVTTAPEAVSFLELSASRLDAIIRGNPIADPAKLNASYQHAVRIVTDNETSHTGRPQLVPEENYLNPDRVKTTTTPSIRVSLERLDELLKISRGLLINRSELTEALNGKDPSRQAAVLDALRNLTEELHARLTSIRMMKFGTLSTRLKRTVHSTCVEENKKAVLEIENGEIEIDTQVIDGLIEPLLHMLKNAVVHGIESRETRRLIGKSEQGVVRLRIEADNDSVILFVTDDGAGISVAKLKERAAADGLIPPGQMIDDDEAVNLIFERGLTTAGKVDMNAGRGVGMSIVKEAIESRGGSILVETEHQRGTKFTIIMPTALLNPHSTPPVIDPKTPPLVLIVDDSASIRSMTAQLVEEFGFRTITAVDGADALELLLSSSFEPALIISDVEMPQIDGWTLLEYIKTDDNFGHIPVVMITSLDADTDRQRALDLGASDYLVKPYGKRDLEAVLEKLTRPVPA